MPEFLSSVVEWFRARSGTEQALIGAAVLIVVAAASEVISVIAMFVFVVAAGAFVVQAVRRRPSQGWTSVSLASLAAAILFFALAGAIYGPTPQEQRSVVDRAEKPATEEEPEPPEEQEEDRGFGVAPQPETPMQQREDGAQQEPPEYSIVDVSIGGPGSTVALTVIAPEVERGEEVARLAAAEYAEHDYVRVNLYASEEDAEERNSYASATVPFSERGARRTGLDVGEMSYERR